MVTPSSSSDKPKCPFHSLFRKDVPEQEPGTAGGIKSIPHIRLSLLGFNALTLLTKLGKMFDRETNVVQIKTELPIKMYAFRHPEHIKNIYTMPGTALTKPPKLLQWADWLMGNGSFNDLGGEEWKRKRRAVDPFFTRESVTQHDQRVSAAVDSMFARWSQRADQRNPLDIYEEMRHLVVDFSFRMVFGTDMGSRIVELAEKVHFAESLFASQMPLWFPTPRALRFRRVGRELHKLFDELIAFRRSSSLPSNDIATGLLGITDPVLNREWTREEIRQECFSVFFGASAMTNPLTWSLCLLSRHPLVLRKVQEELRSVLADRIATADDLPKLTYLEMVLNESMRLLPPFWGSPRISTEPVEIDGHRFPANTILLTMRWFAHRHPDYWQNPEGFDPERFASENRAQFHPVAFMPYGAGPRTCLGRHMAPRVCKLILARVLQAYELHFKPQHPNDPMVAFDFGVLPKNKVMMSLVPRAPSKVEPQKTVETVV